MEWIRIEDREPPQNVYVLIAKYDSRPNVNMFFISIAERMGDFYYDGFDGKEVTCKRKYGKVTHWMPLPDLPKPDSTIQGQQSHL